MVRLKENMTVGSIVSADNFNSSMVRLKATPTLTATQVALFQFLYGAIKSVACNARAAGFF